MALEEPSPVRPSGSRLAESRAVRIARQRAEAEPSVAIAVRRGHHAQPVLRPVALIAFVAVRLLAAGLAARLARQRLGHVTAAFLQRGNRPLLGRAGRRIVALVQRRLRVVHRPVRGAEVGRDVPGQVGELLHQFAQRALQRMLDAGVGLAFGIRIAAPVRSRA